MAAKFPSIAPIRYGRDQARRTETKRETTENDGVSRAAGGSYRNRCLRDAYRGRMCIAITQIAVLFSPAPGDRLREREEEREIEKERGKTTGSGRPRGGEGLASRRLPGRLHAVRCVSWMRLFHFAAVSIDSTSCLSLDAASEWRLSLKLATERGRLPE